MGILISLTIIFIWLFHLIYILNFIEVNFLSFWFYFHLFLQTYFYTGLFITAHDAMHGSISKNKIINKSLGTAATFLYAGLSYNRLIKNHFKHHKDPGDNSDPDFSTHSQNFFVWWATFMFRYATLIQIIIMALAFNILKIWFSEISIWMFWVVPAILSSIQLFYFGTYIPHKYPHHHKMMPHKARTQKRNHLWAMLSCYFFGYHFEHHESPKTPWWQLYKIKDGKI